MLNGFLSQKIFILRLKNVFIFPQKKFLGIKCTKFNTLKKFQKDVKRLLKPKDNYLKANERLFIPSE